MPYYRVTRADLEERLAEITAKGERVTSVASDENGLDLFTESTRRRQTGTKETRA